jgi:CRISPR type III-B/RAMP module-associated protein Cmr3
MSQHIITLSPTDVLFFKDGRPMEGSSSGNGAAWPLPNVLNSAIHHALHRAQDEASLARLHTHTPKRSGEELSAERDRLFGSLQTVGPFPIDGENRWLFPRPADAQEGKSGVVTHRPLKNSIPGSASSLGNALHPVMNTAAPSKNKPEPWLSVTAFQAYLEGKSSPAPPHFVEDRSLFASEHSIGIGIDRETEAQDGERFYSASYLRLKSNVRLGLLCQCLDKGRNGKTAHLDLIKDTFPNSGTHTHILAGGQQRTCTVTRDSLPALPLPVGPTISGTRVKWVLLSPAIFPELKESGKNPTAHPGGWLPSWIHPDTLELQLKDPALAARKEGESRISWRERVSALDPIAARLVAAVIPRAIPVTGWALRDGNDETGAVGATGGARATHLAVPAGAVYYFEAENEHEARKVAAVLNWHGSGEATTVQNRRSTLMGEKGFGLGVCGAWTAHDGKVSGPPRT